MSIVFVAIEDEVNNKKPDSSESKISWYIALGVSLTVSIILSILIYIRRKKIAELKTATASTTTVDTKTEEKKEKR